MNKYYQQGGEMEQLMQLFQAFADTVQDDEFTTAEEVMQMFQELSPEEQQAFVQQAMQMVQTSQEEQMELEEPTMQRGGYVNDTGYLEGYETNTNNFNIIPFNKISMKNVRPDIKYIKGTDNLGNTQYMEHGGEYEFDGDFVLEEPVYAQTGKELQDSYQYKQQRSEVIKKLLKNPNISSFERSTLTTELVKNAKDLKQLETKIQNTPRVNESKIKEIQQAKKVQAAKKAIEQTTAERLARSKNISNIPLTEQQAIAEDDAFNLAKKEKPLSFYEKMRQGKIDKGISKGSIKPVPNVNLSIGNIGEVALQKLSNGSTEVLNQLKKLKVQNPNIKITDLRKYVPKVNSITVKSIEDGLIGGGKSILSAGKTIAKGVGKALPYTAIASTIDDISDLNEMDEKGSFEDQIDYRTQKALGKDYTSDDIMGTFLGINLGKKEEDRTSEKYLKNKARYDALMQQKNTPQTLQVKGKNKTYNLNYNESATDDVKYPSYSDEEGNRWRKNYKGQYYVYDTNQTKEKLNQIENQKNTSLKQDKPKLAPLPEKVNKQLAEQVATPEVLPPPVPIEIPEELDYDFRVPLMDVGNYYIPQEEREVNINPNAFNRTNVGVGKRFFKQYGGATETNFNGRLNPNADINIGAETEQQFYQPYTNKMRLFPNIQLDPVIGQYDNLPMGANSMNYQAPNAESKRMFEGRGSNQLLDLGNYASRFGEDNFGMTTPVSNQTINRKSKFQQFMDKYGKKSDLEFNSNTNQVAPYYNLMKASEPLANQYRANVDMRYAETPLLDPLPVIQQLQNQQRLATQNINTNSPTGQSYLSNVTAQTQQKTVEALNDIQQKNQQIAAQNEQARINAYNQEQQLNIAANQQYLQNQMQAQAAKDLAMGEALSTVDQMQANKVKERNAFNSLTVMTPGLKKSTNLRNLVTGNQGFEIDPEYQKLQYYTTQYKTPQQLEAEKAKKQIGGSINRFLKRK